MGYINVILTAIFVFPVLAFFITLPYIVYNYNKFGSILFIRTLLIYLFILYLLSAYFLIIMPLPSISYVARLTTKVQLVPFDLLSNIIRTVHFNYKDISTYVNIFKNPFVYQTIYNFLLTVPFGIFLRYYFKYSFIKTLLLTFLLSLFFEITQLTGLYFIYPNAYRLFDVDDLIVNTLGGVFGFLVTPLVTMMLPTKEELDLKAYKKGTKVSSTKRIITFIIDIVIIILFLGLELLIDYIYHVHNNYTLYLGISILLFYNFIPLITNGKTLGYKITNIVISNEDNGVCKRYQVLFRNLIFTCIYMPMLYYLYLLFRFINKIANYRYSLLIIIGYISIVMILSIFTLIRNFILHKRFLYEIVTKTKLSSTIEVPKSSVGSRSVESE